MWAGDGGREPWRDTGVELRGPALADLERAFAESWATAGPPLPPGEVPRREELRAAGEAAVRVVATSPATAGMMRIDQLVATLARERLWIADAYYAGTPSYAQALAAAARDGVDVRLLVPGASDLPLLQPLSRIGYRQLLESGVRLFSWNGSMMHAKTAVADGRWARVGSTNLNLSSWIGNRELDLVVEDAPFAAALEAAYVRDLAHATELTLEPGRGRRPLPRPRPVRAGGSAGRAAAGAKRLGDALGAAFASDVRVLEPMDAKLPLLVGLGALLLAALVVAFPWLLAAPVALALAWCAVALFARAARLAG